MDIPDLVQQALGGEEIQAGVSLDDEDAICLTPTRTLIYSGEGLLSDENVAEYPHDVEQIYVKDGRRKRKFVLEYIDGKQSFSVPSNRGEKVLELLLEGVLRLESVIESRESLVGVYLFSELTLVIAEGRLIKHIGEPVWNEDFEVYPFEDVTRLDFERASVATSIVLDIDGRPQRVKVPNDNAPIVRQTLEKALFACFDVSSIEELNRLVDDGEDEAGGVEGADQSDDLAFGSGIDPLVTDHEDEDPLEGSADAFSEGPGAGTETGAANQQQTESSAATADANSSSDDSAPPTSTDDQQSNPESHTASTSITSSGPTETSDETGDSNHAGNTETDSAGPASAETDVSETDAESAADEWTSPVGEQTSGGDEADVDPDAESSPEPNTSETTTATNPSATEAGDSLAVDPETTGIAGEGVSRDEFKAVADRVDELTEAVDRQNELLKRQHKAIKQLVKELNRE